MGYLKNNKIGFSVSLFALFLFVGAVMYKDNGTSYEKHYLKSSNEEEQPYSKPCNSLETCFTIAKEGVVNENA